MLSYKEYKFLNNLEIKAESKKDEGKDEEKGKGSKGLTAAQKKLPKALQDAILAKQGKGGSEEKKCGKYMNEEESSWWKSVSSMFDTDSDHKNWDGGWGDRRSSAFLE